MIDDRLHHQWLFKPKPLDDELLSSWLVRCAYANVRKLHSFCSYTWGTRHHFWERDLDRTADIKILSVMAENTNTARSRAYSTTLAAYEGVLFESFVSSGELPWVMSIGKRGRKRYGFGMQFCPKCLAMDEVPYYRRKWRFSCFVLCPVHGCYLHDCCPSCGEPVTFHQSDYGELVLTQCASLTKCSKCGLDRKSIQPIECENDDRGTRLKAFQQVLSDALQYGWVREPGLPERKLMSLSFFSGLHDLVRVLCSKSRTGKLRKECIDRMRFNNADAADIAGAFDSFRLSKRVCILEMIAWLIESWPNRLVKASREVDLSSSYFFSYKASAAYWFYTAINENLDRSHYHPSRQEIDSCKKFLKSSGLMVSKNNVQRWLGRYYVDKRRYLKL